jgi:uroporphyrinogen decarboxylase
VTSIAAEPYGALKRHLGITGGTTAIYDLIQQLAMPEQWYLDRFEVDVVDVTRAYSLDTSGWQDWELNDGTWAKIPPWFELERDGNDWVCRGEDGTVLGRKPESGQFFDQTYFPMEKVDAAEYEHPEKYAGNTIWAKLPRPLAHLSGDPEFPRLLGEAARDLYENTDYAIMMNSGTSLFESAQFLRRTDNLLMDLAADRRNTEILLDRVLEMNLASVGKQLDAAGPYVNVIKLNDDLGVQNRPFMSPAMFRDIFKPRFKVMYDMIRKKRPDIAIFLHSCGSIAPLLPDLIDIGLDIINPVQTSAADMDPGVLKREYGKDLVFWGGGVDTQGSLPFGTPEDVAEDVEGKIEEFAPGGGFMFAACHNITPGVPPENIVSMFDTFRKFRDY